jgi:phosphatidylglycerophosphate synthase
MNAIVLADPSSSMTLCGLSLLERVLRTLARCGVSRAIVLSPEPIALPPAHWSRAHLDVVARLGEMTCADIARVWPSDEDRLLLVPAGGVYDARLIRALLQADEGALVDSRTHPLTTGAPEGRFGRLCGPVLARREWVEQGHGPLAPWAARALAAGELRAVDVATIPAYIPDMRRHLRPYWFPAPVPETKALAEAVIVDAAQKGALDIPARLHAPIENWLIGRLARTPVSPNQITFVTNLAAWTATGLFVAGHTGTGLLVALGVGILDGLDGKQARVKLECSAIGRLEHVADYGYEMSWWAALAWHYSRIGLVAHAGALLALLVVSDVLDRLVTRAVKLRSGRMLDDTSAIDRAVRLLSGRRNVYVWILALAWLLGHGPAGFALVCVWGFASALVHALRAAWLLGGRTRSGAGRVEADGMAER